MSKHIIISRNASSTPPRLPLLSAPLKDLNVNSAAKNGNDEPEPIYTIVALSYRGYWTSRGRASQQGIEMDAMAALRWAYETYYTGPTARISESKTDIDYTVNMDRGDKGLSTTGSTSLVLWGQSIGAGVATELMRQVLSSSSSSPSAAASHGVPPIKISGIILETPFLSIRSMLDAIYPNKWVPYKYLWPFLRNWWDSEAALRAIATYNSQNSSSSPIPTLSTGEKHDGAAADPGANDNSVPAETHVPPILIIAAGKDELVPRTHADRLQAVCIESGFDVSRQDVSGALHTDATINPAGRQAVVKFLQRVGREERQEKS